MDLTDWKELCERLVEVLELCPPPRGWETAQPDLIASARAALVEPEPEVGEPVKQIAQIVYEQAIMAAADAASRPHWPSWAELPESDARTHAMATAQAILTSCGYYTESETETAERPAVTLRTLLHPGFEPGDGNADGAQLVDGQWHVPVMGCDSLQIAVDNARAALDRPKPNRLADALARWGHQPAPPAEPEPEVVDGPAVPNGREPASVVGEPSDEDLLDLAQHHSVSYIMSDGTVVYPLQHGSDMRDDVLSFARAVLARYGHHFPDAKKMVSQPAPPAPVTDDDLDLLVIAIQALRPKASPGSHDLAAVDRGTEILRKWLAARGMA